MRESLVIVRLARLDSIRKKANTIALTDPKEELLRQELSTLTDKIINLDRSSFTDSSYERFLFDVDTVIVWFNALIDNLNTRLSRSILELLEQISKDWIDTYDQRVLLVTTGDYATRADARIAKDRFVNEYSCSFSVLPLILFVPPHQSDDLFLGVALLHELGHMIDLEWGVTETMVSYIINWARSRKIVDADCNPYFSKLNEINQLHLMELFADVFGAQYSKEYILANVESATLDPTESYETHPSFNNRKNAVCDFLKNQNTKNYSSVFIELMDSVMDKCFQKPLGIHTEDIDESFFDRGAPITFTNDYQLYSIFYNLWMIYEKGPYTLDRYNTMNRTALISLDEHFAGIGS